MDYIICFEKRFIKALSVAHTCVSIMSNGKIKNKNVFKYLEFELSKAIIFKPITRLAQQIT